jgi:hypothetical protein
MAAVVLALQAALQVHQCFTQAAEEQGVLLE